MSKMLRLAQLIEHKYGLTSRGAPTETRMALNEEIAKKFSAAKREIQNAYRVYFQRTGISATSQDQSITDFASKGYDLAERMVKTWNSLGDAKPMTNMNPADFYNRMFYAYVLGMHALQNAGHFVDKVKDETPNLSTKIQEDLDFRRFRFDNQVVGLWGVLFQAARTIKPLIAMVNPEVANRTIPEPPPKKTHYMSRREITNFIQTNPVAIQYGLTMPVLQKLIMSDGLMYFPREREALVKFINAAKSGKNPKGGPELFAKIKAIRDAEAAKATTNLPYLEDDDTFEASRQVYLDPGERASREALEEKKRLEQERGEQLYPTHEESMEALQPQLEQAERTQQEAQQKLQQEQEQKKKEEEDLASKYSSLTFEKWMRR